MPSTNITLRLDNNLLQRIDQAAMQQGMNRTTYMLSWLPETYTSTAQPTTNHPTNAYREASRRETASPAS